MKEKTNDTKIHLCEKCEQDFATCRPNLVRFGNGKGNDNVIKCSAYDPKLEYSHR